MNHVGAASAQLAALADHLARRRDAILAAWRRAVDTDPDVSTASKSTRQQFIDHIPSLLEAFEDRLRSHDPVRKAEACSEQKESAAQHGVQRWQQGYQLTETIREWGHLHLCLLAEVERYSRQHLVADSQAPAIACRELARLTNEGIAASVARYTQLQQSEAASRLYDLETALADLKALEVERAESWRQAAHDLRGNAQVIASASAMLNRADVPDAKRDQVSAALSVASDALSRLLGDLLDQARLEAGHERRRLTAFDAAALIKEFCDSTRALVAERNLFLKCEGPPELLVEGDSAKVQRILQNLLLNALKVTQSGGIRVIWEAGASPANPNQWALCVQDTGPGFRSWSTPIKTELKDATIAVHDVEQAADAAQSRSLAAEPPATLTSQATAQGHVPAGEGIGLSIVKRLCELLDASIELQSAEGQGTTFRLIFPRYYTRSPE